MIISKLTGHSYIGAPMKQTVIAATVMVHVGTSPTRSTMVDPNPETQASFDKGGPFEFNITKPGVLIPKWGY